MELCDTRLTKGTWHSCCCPFSSGQQQLGEVKELESDISNVESEQRRNTGTGSVHRLSAAADKGSCSASLNKWLLNNSWLSPGPFVETLIIAVASEGFFYDRQGRVKCVELQHESIVVFRHLCLPLS